MFYYKYSIISGLRTREKEIIYLITKIKNVTLYSDLQYFGLYVCEI